MNTLIKIVITTVIGFFGPLTEVENSRVNFQAAVCKDILINTVEKQEIDYCLFNEKSCKMLNNKFES